VTRVKRAIRALGARRALRLALVFGLPAFCALIALAIAGPGVSLAVLVVSAVVVFAAVRDIRLVVRRAGWMVATLFGVILVTFGAIHLAPGEPAGRRLSTGPAPLSPEELDVFRRTHNLHLPVFLNLDIKDRHRRAVAEIERLDDADNEKEAARALIDMATLAFPELVKAVGRDGGAYSEVMRRILARIDAPGAPSSARRTALLKWWAEHEESFSPGSLRRMVDKAVSRPLGPENVDARRVRWHHMRAVPFLVEALRNGSPERQARACRLLGSITQNRWRCDVESPPEERWTAIELWKEYYERRKLQFVDLETWERLTGTVTQTRFFGWLHRFLTLGFGTSLYYHRPVADVIGERLPVTLTLGLAALLVSYLIAVPLGVAAGSRPQTTTDKTISFVILVLYCLPVFWVAMTLMVHLGGIKGPDIFPHSGMGSADPSSWPLGSRLLDRLWHMALPVLTLSYGSVALLARYQRDEMAEVLSKDYIRTAQAKGLDRRRIVWKHGWRNGAIPMIHLLGLQIPYLLSGSVIVERVFDLPGLGLLAFTAIEMRDYNLLMGLVSLTAVLTLGGQLLADLLAAAADPRQRAVRAHGQGGEPR
jgi:peptide/nickel transport system permease protein